MSDEAPKKPKGGKMGLVLGLVLMLVCGGGSFYVVYSGLLALPLPEKEAAAGHGAAPADSHGDPHGAPAGGHAAASFDGKLPETAFLALDPIIVTIGKGETLRHLQFGAQLEIEPAAHDAVAMLTPRAVDVLNTYLRAVNPADLEDPAAMLRMRAQMLRRVQVVMGEGKVRDLLVAEFIMR